MPAWWADPVTFTWPILTGHDPLTVNPYPGPPRFRTWELAWSSKFCFKSTDWVISVNKTTNKYAELSCEDICKIKTQWRFFFTIIYIFAFISSLQLSNWDVISFNKYFRWAIKMTNLAVRLMKLNNSCFGWPTYQINNTSSKKLCIVYCLVW